MSPTDERQPELGSRALFPELECDAYLNHASMSPWSAPVRREMNRCGDDYARKGLGALMEWRPQRKRLKEKIATLIGAQGGDIALVPSTTRGLIDLALCMPWQRGDRVIVFSGEFPTNVTPWQRAAELFGLDLVMLEAELFRTNEEEALASFESELESRGARLVAVSAVEFQTGYRMPVDAMARACHRAGAEIVVDAIQALGIVPMNVVASEIDYLVCGSHKWLMGPEGIAFVYATKDPASRLRPHVAGWLSHESPVDFLLEGPGRLRYDRPIRSTIDFLENGSLSTIGCAGLEAALDILIELGPTAIFTHVQAYLDELEPLLVELSFESLRASNGHGRSGTLSVLPPSGVEVTALSRALGEAGIICAVPDGHLRFSPHWPNARSELEHVGAELRRIVAAKG